MPSSWTKLGKGFGSRDPDDVDLLALALHLKAAVWSNDRDFRDAGIELWTTAELLAELDRGR